MASHTRAINDAVASMRDGWEVHKSEIRHMFPANYWSAEAWRKEAITYVSQLMPGETNDNILIIAGRLLSG
jgi:hypothetical protein